jgi:hypothetical protein
VETKYGEAEYLGPFSIEKVYGNGTVKIKKGIITERVNIRLIKPYYE